MKKLTLLALLICTFSAPVFAYDDEDADRYNPWSNSYESPFDKPKDRGPYYEDPVRKEDRVKTIRPSAADRRANDTYGYQRGRSPSGGEFISRSLRD